MSATLNKTVSIAYTILETGARLRREVFSDRDSYQVVSDYEIKEIALAASQQITLVGIEGLFFLACDSPLQFKVNNSDYFAVQKSIWILAPLNEVIIFNPSTATVNCKLIDS